MSEEDALLNKTTAHLLKGAKRTILRQFDLAVIDAELVAIRNDIRKSGISHEDTARITILIQIARDREFYLKQRLDRLATYSSSFTIPNASIAAEQEHQSRKPEKPGPFTIRIPFRKHHHRVHITFDFSRLFALANENVFLFEGALFHAVRAIADGNKKDVLFWIREALAINKAIWDLLAKVLVLEERLLQASKKHMLPKYESGS